MNHLGEQVDSSAELIPMARAVTGRWREVIISIRKGSWAGEACSLESKIRNGRCHLKEG